MQHAGPKVEELFCAALELEGSAARSAFLDRACGDPELRRRVEELLEADPEANDLLEVPAPIPAATAPLDSRTGVEEPGTVIGPYKLREQIGEGGMGVVYVAEQTQPVRRKVALKIIKPGMDTRQVIARFEAERQALAMMDHPNIAKVHDGGTTESGRPYFVMELVRGMPIIEYCDAERLSIRDRLELFVLVCRAVQHAHQKGIIHRDLKPSNILVTLHDGVPVPKVIDFGVAKAAGQSLTERTIYTAFTQLVGTPLYMSPEQVELSGLDVDTRSDIYSLGVLLYELLTGTTPFDSESLNRAAFDEMRRIIREEEPPKPSTRLSSLGETLTATSMKRSCDPRQLNRSVRGELDWIVMKALEKDRRRRYETANDFAADVMRYLTDRPVEACPPSAWYRFGKSARRNRAVITTATVLAAALILGTAISTWQAILARRAQRDARGEAEKARQSKADTEAFSKFLLEDVLAVARPEGVQGGLGVDVTVAQALETAEKHLEERFAGRPLAAATARHAIGVTWRNLERFEQAERHLRTAVELRQQGLGPDDPATLDALNSLGVTLTQMGRYAEAVPLLEETLDKSRGKLGPDDPNTLMSAYNLALAYGDAGKSEKALRLYEKTVETMKAKLGHDDPTTLRAMGSLGWAYYQTGRIDQALPLLEQTVRRMKASLGPDHRDTLVATGSLAALYQLSNLTDRALALFEELLETFRAKFGPDHTATLIIMGNLASAYRDAGQPGKAEPLLIEAVSGLRRKLGLTHPQTELYIRHLTVCYERLGHPEKAESLFRELAAAWKAKTGEDSPEYADHLGLIAWYLILQQRPADAEPLYREALQVARKRIGERSQQAAHALAHLGLALLRQRKYTEAERSLRESLDIVEKQHLDGWGVFLARSHLGASLLGQQRYIEAEPLLLAGYEGMKQREAQMRMEGVADRKLYLTEALERLVQLYDARGQKDKADEWRKKLPVTEAAKRTEPNKH
jgi:serine/threonine protein kinase/Tfp pilus assembly protein PilF